MSSEMRYFPSSADDNDEQEPSGYPRVGATPNIADRFADLLARECPNNGVIDLADTPS